MMATWLEEHGVELVVLAGYMHVLTRPFLDRFPGRVVNVHPSLLPAFPGLDAIAHAVAAGVETTGVTVHLVDEGVDTGPVLRQEEVPVEPRETLEERIHAVEHRLLPAVVAELAAVATARRPDARADLLLRQDRARRARGGPGRARLGAGRERRHRRLPRGARPAGHARREPDRVRGHARPPGGHAPPRRARRDPRAARRPRGPRRPRRARHQAVRPRRRQPLPVHRGRSPARGPRGGGRRDDRRRRACAPPRGGEELRPRRTRRAARAVRRRARRAARERRALARDAPLARDRGVRGHRRLRVGDRRVVRRPRDVPGRADPDVLEGAGPRLRREPTPAGGLLRGGAAHDVTCSLGSSSSAAASSRTTT